MGAKIKCEPGNCKAARPERCGCQMRLLFADTKTVSIKGLNGERASLVRVVWPDGSFINYPVEGPQ